MTKRFVEDIEMGKVFNIYSVDVITYDIINLRGWYGVIIQLKFYWLSRNCDGYVNSKTM